MKRNLKKLHTNTDHVELVSMNIITQTFVRQVKSLFGRIGIISKTFQHIQHISV